ncbi:MAG: fumarylacetoacetate hydrolase family protein [Candidatus Omnitrophica bacterium]|nr:fumarylacetoacetate hydrolase family protein [Candidatus Omnitrophota bacterium]
MRIARFNYKSKQDWGIVKDSQIIILKDSPFAGVELTSEKIPLDKVKLLAPGCAAGKIVLTGLNYRDHAKELGMALPQEPVIFLKPATSLIGHGGNIIYPEGVSRLDYEAELALVIKKTGRNIPEDKAAEYILGYTCLNDVTARGLQKKDIQWTRAKSFDTFCPLGPWLETELDTSNLKIASYLNGGKKQDSTTANLIFSANYLVSFISKIMTLLPGDIISTGTPCGVGPMAAGDKIEVEIEGIGLLTNQVARAS